MDDSGCDLPSPRFRAPMLKCWWCGGICRRYAWSVRERRLLRACLSLSASARGSERGHFCLSQNRDLLTDIQAMLCADGLAISRSTLHFLTFAHSRATHYFVPSACGPGTYTRKTRRSNDGTKKPNPNNTTLLCIERPGAEVTNTERFFIRDLVNGGENLGSTRISIGQ